MGTALGLAWSRRRGLTRSAPWLFLLAGHLPATCAALLGGVDHLGRALLLLAAQTFFLLKAADVPWLRLPTDRRRLAALAAGIVLLHARLIESKLPHDLDAPVSWQIVALCGAGSFAGALVHSPRPIERTPRAAAGAADRRRFALTARAAAELPPRFLALERSLLPNRAPPQLIL